MGTLVDRLAQAGACRPASSRFSWYGRHGAAPAPAAWPSRPAGTDLKMSRTRSASFWFTMSSVAHVVAERVACPPSHIPLRRDAANSDAVRSPPPRRRSQVLKSGFVGRRREMYALRRDLRGGRYLRVVQGTGELGKSAFCSKAPKVYKRLG